GEQPRLDRTAAKRFEMPECTQITFLRSVFRISGVAQQIAHERVDVIEIWQHRGAEALRLAMITATFVRHASRLHRCVITAAQYFRSPPPRRLSQSCADARNKSTCRCPVS